MIAEKLRKSIFQAAIEGKLTEQLPKDGDARDLVEEIKKEKEELIKAGKIKKEKPLPEIREEEIPFDIPDNWCWVRLGEIINYITDGAHKTPKYTRSGVPFVSVKDMSSGVLDLSDTKFISIEEHEELIKRCYPQKGDILLSKVGTTGVPALVDTDEEFSLFVSVALLKINKKYLSNLFLQYLLESPLVQEQAKFSTKGVGNKNWVIRDIRQTLIPICPFDEQIRIVEKIGSAYPSINLLKYSEEKLNQLEEEIPQKIKNSILQAAMQGKLTDQLPEDGYAHDLLEEIQAEKQSLIAEGKLKKQKPLPPITEEEIPFDIPDNWVWTKLEIITNKVGSKSNQIKKSEIKKTGKIPVITQGKTFIEGYSNDETKVIKEVPVIMFGDHTRNVKYIDFPFIIGADGTQIHQSLINDKYLYYWMALASEKLKNRGYQRHYTLLKKELIPLPPITEQNRIVTKLKEINSIKEL